MAAIFSFVTTSIGSVIIGMAVALAAAFLFKQAQLKDPAYEFSLIIFFAYGSYCIAEIMGLSGIMSLFFCGILMAHYARHNISEHARTATHYTFRSFSLISETFLFSYLGLTAVVSLRSIFHLHWSPKLIGFTMLLCLLSRAMHIFPFSALANTMRRRKISRNMQVLMWFAGLRGAIAFALALNVEGPGRALIITTTQSIVIFTTLFCGGLTHPLLTGLNLVTDKALLNKKTRGKRMEEREPEMQEPPSVLLEEIRPGRPQGCLHRIRSRVPDLYTRWADFDSRHMKRLFGGKSRRRNSSLRRQEIQMQTLGASTKTGDSRPEVESERV